LKTLSLPILNAYTGLTVRQLVQRSPPILGGERCTSWRTVTVYENRLYII